VGQVNLADSTDNEWYLTGVQLEVGQNPTEFEHEPFQVTLSKCQRYFHKITNLLYGGYGADSAGDYSTIWFPTELRATPTMTGVNSGSTMQNVTKEFAQVYYVGGYAAWSSGATASAEL
jgi:hypothetical protein